MTLETEEPYQRLSRLSFGTYSDVEVQRLSVKEITNPNSFDSLMHPTYGGLYDPHLGAVDRDDVCATCRQNYIHCPGHMGHISLAVPVYNPVFFNTMYQILKGSCQKCHNMLVRNCSVTLLTMQLQSLSLGFLGLVQDLQETMNNTLMDDGGDLQDTGDLADQLNKVLLQAINDGPKSDGRNHSVKNIEELRSKLIKDFIKTCLHNSKCPHCYMPSRKLRQEHYSKLYYTKGYGAKRAKQVIMKRREKLRLLEQKRQAEQENIAPEEIVLDRTEKENENDEAAVESLTEQMYLTPEQARQDLRLIWQNCGPLLRKIYGCLDVPVTDTDSYPTDMFFLSVVPVPPSRFRPISQMGDKRFENPQSGNLVNVIKSNYTIRRVLQQKYREEVGQENSTDTLLNASTAEIGSTLEDISGKTLNEKLNNSWIQLQTKINCCVDCLLDKLNRDKNPGIKQLLEKKQGLFRKNMMGKRVNYAARSVISPDPYINTDEIGIPSVFAKKLTYPEPVTPWNVQELRRMVMNGPDVHPGAAFVINEDGSKLILKAGDKTHREAVAKQLLTPSSTPGAQLGTKKVYRHLKNGDVLLLNRQPTLHRPSMQAHKARILPGEKTLRLHYANCKAYNADFDGDEMNAHFPQNEICRAEAYNIASTNFQYLVPKDGSPLAGLIQDHMVSGVMLTIRGRFFNREDYQQLLYNALTDKDGPVLLLPPSIIKPVVRWSGKQVLSSLLLNLIPQGKDALNLIGTAKVPSKAWVRGTKRPWKAGGSPLQEGDMTESQVIIRQGELLVGVLDKAHYGSTPYSLVHCCYELYGGVMAGQLLTSLAKLFTTFLQQIKGFTLGVQDILCVKKGNKKRREIMAASKHCGPEVAARALDLKDFSDPEVLKDKLQAAHFSKEDLFKDLDLCMKGKTNEFQNSITKAIMPEGLLKQFPDNNLQLMVQAGAKGSSVNCMQISCLLGQIELEGRRPPIMISGKSLPSFLPYETCPRAGGYIDGRFLTGIRPQEYFHHCMAGREGLVDTAVKTSRSGYLQRCIIKHLEGLVVGYDMVVRDSDGSVVQFQYGEDSLDVCKTQFLKEKQFAFMMSNKAILMDQQQLAAVKNKLDTKTADKMFKEIQAWKEKHQNTKSCRKSAFLNYAKKKWSSVIVDHSTSVLTPAGRCQATEKLIKDWRDISVEKRKKKWEKNQTCPLPVTSKLPPQMYFGAVSQNLNDTVQSYVERNPGQCIKPGKEEEFLDLVKLRNMRALVEPGESVGLLAAQSIGEPSTQMTLNTFHFAGRGEMNVTLGIPRLREILMVASQNIKTPNMDVPLLKTKGAEKKAQALRLKLTKVYLSDVLENVEISETLSLDEKFNRRRLFRIRFNFLPYSNYKDKYYVTPNFILDYMERKFFKAFTSFVKRKIQEISESSLLNSGSLNRREAPKQDDEAAVGPVNRDEDNDEAEDDDQNDGDATATKVRERQQQERDYDGEDEEKEELAEEVLSEESESESEGEEEDAMGENSDGETSRSQTPTKNIDEKLRKKTTKKKVVINAEMEERRVQGVVSCIPNIEEYTYDANEEEWCEILFGMPITQMKIDLSSILESLARRTVLFFTPGITRAILTDSKKPGEEGLKRLKTEGVNIQELYKSAGFLDLNKLYSNDIHAIANTYGIEAAAKVLVQEIRDVFAAYGIQVDYRHLSLIADYMTFEGMYKPFNRMGLESNPSPLQKMTFETTMSFLKTATISGSKDDLKSPSARLVVGRVVNSGTGVFDLVHK
ncbi:unnamed protein product [Owenia fusiformis]|uniref:DNA-directed RNA polymerase subunit n=1 Tax=Owenia fusiformis TaxID=6347 RepID=A0A8S4MYS1_OWEFU|nr:unnamed protein product [Owenia fusiformis]